MKITKDELDTLTRLENETSSASTHCLQLSGSKRLRRRHQKMVYEAALTLTGLSAMLARIRMLEESRK
jgi:hypothetical protein